MADQTIKIVLSATGDAQVAGAAQRAAKGLDALDASQKRVGISAAQQAAAMRALPAQLTDITVGLASGLAPLTVFLQQGGQLKDMFGGAGAAAKAVGGAVLGLLSPINLAVAAVGALGYAAYQGAQESNALANSLRTTGGYAGQTIGQLESLTRRLQVSTGSSIGNVRELTAALVGTGQFGPQSLGEVVSAMARVQSLTGQTADQVVKDFSGMSSGVAKWAAEHNKQYHFLSVAQFAHIQQLEKQGKLEEAMRTTASALDGALAARAPQLGLLEKAWKALGDAASKAWDDMKGIGRAETVEQQIAAVQAKLEANARRTDRADSVGPNGRRRGADSVAADLQAQLEGLQELQRMQNRAASAQGEQAQRDQAGISKLMDTGAQSRAMQAALATLQEQLRLRQDIYKAGEAEIDNLQKGGVLNELQATTQKAAIRQRAVEDERETTEQRLAILRRYSDTEKEQATAQGEILVMSVRAQAQAAQSQAAIHQAAYERFQADQQNYSKIVDSMRSLTERVRDANASASTGLITDPQARALAQYRQDIVQLEREIADQRRKGSFDLIGGDELERQYEQTRSLLGDKLAQSLKPEWQVLVEGWRDTTRLMREASDEMTLGIVRGSEDAFVKVLRSGKLNFNSLRDEITNTFLRTTFRETLGGPAATAGKALSNLLFGGGKKSETQGKTEDALQSLTDKITETVAGLGKAGSGGDLFATAISKASGLLSGLGGIIQSAAAAVAGFVASMTSSSSTSAGMGIFSLLVGGGASGAKGGGDAAGIGTGTAAAGAWFHQGAANFLGGVRAFAQGGAFTNSIVNSPTHFRFAHGGGFGLGLMGEAGPEAIMPLRRARNGALGVVASGGGGPTVVQFQLGDVNVGAGVSPSQVTAAVSLAVDAAQARFVENMQRGNRAFQPPRS